jgi:hypothetical protein
MTRRVRALVAGTAVAWLAGAACSTNVHSEAAGEKSAMSQPATPSRGAPPSVPPVEHKGVRYQQDMQAARFGGTGRGGYLVAVDPKTGNRLWMLKVYPVADHSAAGVSSPGIYFRSMKLAGPDSLEIENEVGGKYIVDLAAHTARWVSGPESGRQ